MVVEPGHIGFATMGERLRYLIINVFLKYEENHIQNLTNLDLI